MLVLIRLLEGEVINGGVFLAGSEVRVEQAEAARLIGLEKAVAVETGDASETRVSEAADAGSTPARLKVKK